MISSEVKWYLGIDIGGTTAKYARISAEGKVSQRGSFPTGAACGREEFLARFFSVVEEGVLAGALGIGISCLGIIDSRSGKVCGGAENLPILPELNLKELLMTRYPNLPVYICNDVKAAARGEQWMGAGRNSDHFFCITFGTGLGGCAVIGGKVLEGAFSRAGEIGYWDYQDDKHYCERRLSTGYVMAAAARKLGIPAIDGISFFARVRQGDAVCLAVLDDWTAEIARVIAHIVLLLDPEKIILGGGIAPQSDLLLPRIGKALGGVLPPDVQAECSIAFAECGNDAGMLGAVSVLARQSEQQRKS